jgi:hypothetical protein
MGGQRWKERKEEDKEGRKERKKGDEEGRKEEDKEGRKKVPSHWH